MSNWFAIIRKKSQNLFEVKEIKASQDLTSQQARNLVLPELNDQILVKLIYCQSSDQNRLYLLFFKAGRERAYEEMEEIKSTAGYSDTIV